MEINFKISFNNLKIYFDNILHLKIDINKLVGIQSWKRKHKYFIEYTFDNNTTIECEYDSRDKWEKILKYLDENDF